MFPERPEPLREYECFVIKAGAEYPAEFVEQDRHIETQPGPALRGSSHKTIVQLDLRCPKIRQCGIASADLHYRVRFFGTVADNAAWTMVFETPANELHAVCQQC